MNLIEYRRSVAKKIREELICGVRHWQNEYVIIPCGNTTSYEIKSWLLEHQDILEIKDIDEKRIDAVLINYEQYEANTKEEKRTQYDDEIQELEQRLKELKELRNNEIEKNKKNKKIAELKKKLDELEAK